MEKIKKFIELHGNNFHVEVVNFLRKEGWEVLISPYFRDNSTDKSREVDIIAEKDFPTWSLGGLPKTVKVRFFIECKYINGEIVFWFDKKNIAQAIGKITKETPLLHPSKNTNIQDHHHYYIKEVAKLFSTVNSNETKNLENETFFKAINQSLHSLIYYRGRLQSLTGETGDLVLNYPIIICNSFEKFYKTEFQDNDVKNIEESFQLEVNYAYINHTPAVDIDITEYFLIDVVSLPALDNFLQDIEKKDLSAINIMIN